MALGQRAQLDHNASWHSSPSSDPRQASGNLLPDLVRRAVNAHQDPVSVKCALLVVDQPLRGRSPTCDDPKR